MKLLIAVIIIGALVTTIVVYSNTRSSNKTIVESNDVDTFRTDCFPLPKFEENN
jgi:hypothetical protein